MTYRNYRNRNRNYRNFILTNIEFKPLDGEVPWDTFFNRTKKEVVIQFDMGNGVAEGGDPVLYLK